MTGMTNVEGLFNALTAGELEALSATFRRARQAGRRVMYASWNNAPVTEAYRRMVVDFQHHDPLFTAEWRHREIGF